MSSPGYEKGVEICVIGPSAFVNVSYVTILGVSGCVKIPHMLVILPN